MSADLERCADSLDADIVPAAWAALSYPSLRPLHSWLHDLCQVRLRFLSDWVDNHHRPPAVIHLAALFYPNSFLTAVLQNYVRKQKGAVQHSDVVFDVEFVDNKQQTVAASAAAALANAMVPPTPSVHSGSATASSAAAMASLGVDIKQQLSVDGSPLTPSAAAASPSAAASAGEDKLPKATDGSVYIRGLWLEGGAWDYGKKQLTDLKGNSITVPAPIVCVVRLVLLLTHSSQPVFAGLIRCC
jgi:hypothetical protein